MSEQVYRATAKSQLERLATLTDVVYAVALVVRGFSVETE